MKKQDKNLTHTDHRYIINTVIYTHMHTLTGKSLDWEISKCKYFFLDRDFFPLCFWC